MNATLFKLFKNAGLPTPTKPQGIVDDYGNQVPAKQSERPILTDDCDLDAYEF